VRPLADPSGLGYCEECGIVYALKGGGKGERVTDVPEALKVGAGGEPEGTEWRRGTSAADVTPPGPSSGAYWRCPDCDTAIRADNDSELGFAKREHIREYHPNRPTG
jgi:hypothetical protein